MNIFYFPFKTVLCSDVHYGMVDTFFYLIPSKTCTSITEINTSINIYIMFLLLKAGNVISSGMCHD